MNKLIVKCSKCDGTGSYRQFGMCFRCKGTGQFTTTQSQLTKLEKQQELMNKMQLEQEENRSYDTEFKVGDVIQSEIDLNEILVIKSIDKLNEAYVTKDGKRIGFYSDCYQLYNMNSIL